MGMFFLKQGLIYKKQKLQSSTKRLLCNFYYCNGTVINLNYFFFTGQHTSVTSSSGFWVWAGLTW